MDGLTQQIASFATRFTFQQMPQKIVDAMKLRMFDAVGCAMGGARCEAAEAGRRIASGGKPDKYVGRMIGSRGRTNAEEATFVNTSMIRYLDYNDGHHASHPSDMMGAMFSLAEWVGASGPRLIQAIACGYEVTLRIVRATKLRELGWDQGYACGVGCTAGVANLLGLTFEQTAHAVAITAVANVPTRASRAGQLSHWKGSATAYACRNAVYSALLGAEGVTSPDKPFEGRHGLWENITGPFKIEPFPDEGGEPLVPHSLIKYFPTDGNAATAIWTAFQLRDEKANLDDVTNIDMGTFWSAYHENGSEPEKWDPTTRETADHSLPFLFARAFFDGKITPGTFEMDLILDPKLRPIMNKITVRADDWAEAHYQKSPKSFAMRTTLTYKNGEKRVIDIVNPKGQPQNPMNQEEVRGKFMSMAELVLGAPRADRAADLWLGLDRAESVGPAMEALEFED